MATISEVCGHYIRYNQTRIKGNDSVPGEVATISEWPLYPWPLYPKCTVLPFSLITIV